MNVGAPGSRKSPPLLHALSSLLTVIGITLTAFVSTHAYSKGGGGGGSGVGNGGGSRAIPRNVIPANEAGAIFFTKVSEWKHDFSDLLDPAKQKKSGKPIRALRCKSLPDYSFPEFPGALDSSLTLVHSSGRPLKPGEVCQDPELLLSYTHLLAALYALESDPIFAELLAQLGSRGLLPVKVAIATQPANIRDHDRVYAENYRYDLKSHTIHWSQPKPKGVMSQIAFGRNASAALLHELGHVLTSHIFRSSIRSRGTTHHYERLGLSEDGSTHAQIGARDYYAMTTDPVSAMLEAFSNTLEAGHYIYHPMIQIRFGATGRLIQHPELGKYGLLFDDSEDGGIEYRIRRDRARSLLAHESFLSTILRDLVVRPYAEKIEQVEEIRAWGDTSARVSTERTVSLIRSIARLDRVDFRYWMLELDRVSQDPNQEGRRLYQSAFLEDAVSGKSLVQGRPLLTVPGSDAGPEIAFSIDEARELFLEPVVAKEREQASAESAIRASTLLTRRWVVTILKQIQTEAAETRKKVASLATSEIHEIEPGKRRHLIDEAQALIEDTTQALSRSKELCSLRPEDPRRLEQSKKLDELRNRLSSLKTSIAWLKTGWIPIEDFVRGRVPHYEEGK